MAEEDAAPSGQELFYHLTGRVFEEKINSFGELKQYLAKAAPFALQDVRYYAMISKIFSMIRRLSWGFFIELSKKDHERLWEMLVVEDKRWKEAGDLKKMTTLTGIYIASLDISGYTKFCNDNKTRIDRIHNFDRLISNEVERIAAACQSLSKRERGDELFIISASASDCVLAVISIIDYFMCTRSLAASTIDTARSGPGTALPTFRITAGIAGGNIPLIITETGDLSGPLLNTALRLQERANEISPRDAKILITRHVCNIIEKESGHFKSPIFEEGAVSYFDSTQVELKGVQVPCCEVLFKNSDKYKSELAEEVAKLEEAMRTGQWEHNVFAALINVIVKAITSMDKFAINLPMPKDAPPQILTNDIIERRCIVALNSFLHKQNYFRAVEVLNDVVKKISVVPGFDTLVLNYARGISERYETVIKPFGVVMEKLVEEKKHELFEEKDISIYETLKKNSQLYQKFYLQARDSPKLKQRRAYWNLIIKNNKETIMLPLYSGRK